MQKLINIQPKGFMFVNMSTTPEEGNQMLNAQVAMQSVFMMQMGDHLSNAAHEMRKSIKEN